ncbi:hypothetical protein, partial [Amphritea pacifica]|uniref:hypothetical protein n=1 Tax=Amphritea pacifica TaxID=2811233 RepID=UPI001963902B
AGGKVDGLGIRRIPAPGHGEGHQATLTDAHVANAEAGGVVIRTGAWVEWTRAGAVIDDGSHAGTVSDLA